LDKPVLLLFYAAFLITLFELIEEIIIVCILPQWETNVKGLYWVLRKQKEQMPGATRIPADKVNA
jgi:CDP-diacylglycerol--glycerol-3-phosphate 3-phosphatidyltransferase